MVETGHEDNTKIDQILVNIISLYLQSLNLNNLYSYCNYIESYDIAYFGDAKVSNARTFGPNFASTEEISTSFGSASFGPYPQKLYPQISVANMCPQLSANRR